MQPRKFPDKLYLFDKLFRAAFGNPDGLSVPRVPFAHSSAVIKKFNMLKSHNPLDVDMAALKKGEIDLGTSMYHKLNLFNY